MRVRLAVLVMATGFWGCDGTSSEPPITPNKTVRAPIEGPEPATEPTRFGYDENGHLLPARSLVHGFEVPLGLGEPETHHDYLEFTLRAPMERIKEFYLGREAVTDKRFSERDYRIDEGRNGFEVWHTERTLRRLGLHERYREAHIFVTPRLNRVQTLRVHLPRDRTERRVFVPDLAASEGPRTERYLDDPEPTPASPPPGSRNDSEGERVGSNSSPSSQAKSGSGTTGSEDGALRDSAGQPERMPGAPSGEGSDTPPLPPTGAGPAQQNQPQQGPGPRLVTDDQIKQATEAQRRRYGPYPDNRKRDIRPLLRDWQKRNPGKTFLD